MNVGTVFRPVVVASVLLAASVSVAGVPSTIKDRFVLGDPVWKELPIEAGLASDYETCWKKLVDIVVDKGYDVGFMDKESGYLRTNPNSGIVRLKRSWVYEIKVVVKFVMQDAALREGKKVIEKIRIQVQGHVFRLNDGVLDESYSGYDKIVLQDFFNDLQLVFGRQ